MKNKYYKEKFESVRNDLKKTWQVINEITRNNNNNMDQNILKNFNEDASTIAENFAEQFIKGVEGSIHSCEDKVFGTITNTAVNNSIFLEEASIEEIDGIIKKMDTNKGPGADGIRMRDIKANSAVMSRSLTKLLNCWMRDAKMPCLLKSAVVRPIYKSGTKSDYGNYKPISILSAIEKIMEEVLVRRITKFLQKYKVIDNRQFGFQKGKNINQLLGNFANVLNESLSKNLHNIVMFIDFSKAFDTIPHEKLLKCLENNGLRGKCLNILKDYLQNRSFIVKVGNICSEEKKIHYGVPQGSKLGPILFLIYANDMLKQLKNPNVFAYADDTAVVNSSISLHSAIYKCQQDLDIISKWCHDNGLYINSKKPNRI